MENYIFTGRKSLSLWKHNSLEKLRAIELLSEIRELKEIKMKYILAFLIIVGGAVTGFSQAKPLTFADESTLEIVDEQEGEDSPSPKITVQYRYFDAVLSSFGKTLKPLHEGALRKLARTNKSLAAQIKKIHSAYGVTQGDSRFYFATFNSVDYENFRNCDPDARCRIKCEAIIITLDDKGKKENIVIIKSIRKIK